MEEGWVKWQLRAKLKIAQSYISCFHIIDPFKAS